MAYLSKLTGLFLLSVASLALLSRAQIGEEILDHRGITQEDIAQMDAKIDDEVAGGDPSKQVRKDWAKTTEQTDEDKKLMEEWEQHMHDFVPEDITTVVVEPRREVTFYEDIKEDTPQYIRGAFFVGQSSTTNKLIDFFVVNPKNKVIFSKRKAEEGIFRFNTSMPGRYSFIFSNIKDRKSIKDVTVAIHTPGESNEELEQERQEEKMVESLKADTLSIDSADLVKDIDVENIRQAMKKIYTEVRSLATEAKMSFIRQDSVNQIVEDNNNSSFYGTLLESLIFVAIAGAQVWYIRNMLEQKRII